jgi:hypothetical protein
MKAVIFDCGGVLVDDMRWDLITQKTQPFLQDAVEKKIKEEWAKMRIDSTYQEETFWKGISTRFFALSTLFYQQLRRLDKSERMTSELYPSK